MDFYTWDRRTIITKVFDFVVRLYLKDKETVEADAEICKAEDKKSILP